MFWKKLDLNSGSTPAWLAKLPIQLINKYAEAYNIDAIFLAAIVQTESGGNRWAMKYEPLYIYTFNTFQLANVIGCSQSTMEVMQKTSWGLMQVMGSVAYEMGLGTEMNGEKWPSSLLDPDKGMAYGCRFLKRKIDSYGAVPEVVYAAYNGGAPRRNSAGTYVNQKQVSNFNNNFRLLGGDY